MGELLSRDQVLARMKEKGYDLALTAFGYIPIDEWMTCAGNMRYHISGEMAYEEPHRVSPSERVMGVWIFSKSGEA